MKYAGMSGEHLPTSRRECAANTNLCRCVFGQQNAQRSTFMYDTLFNGRKVRILNIIDDINREGLTINADYSQSGRTVVSALKDLKYWRGRPIEIRCDNGPEFLSNHFVEYYQKQGILSSTSRPENPLSRLISSAIKKVIAKIYGRLNV